MVPEYQADELAADSEDEKKISKAEKAAKQKSNKRKKGTNLKRTSGPAVQSQLPKSEWDQVVQLPHSFSDTRSTVPGLYQLQQGHFQDPIVFLVEFGHIRANCLRRWHHLVLSILL